MAEGLGYFSMALVCIAFLFVSYSCETKRDVMRHELKMTKCGELLK